MNSTKRLGTLTGALTFMALAGFGQLSVDNAIDIEDAIQNVLLGEGVQVSGISFSGDDNQIGIFNAEMANVNMSQGIIIGTGDVLFAQTGADGVGMGGNENTGGSLGGFNIGASDADLEALSSFDMHDAAILEFDFVADGDSIAFSYVFASEEYNEYVCGTNNDAFGFFLSGPGITGPFLNDAANLALIPDTDIPVTVNTVNNGQVGTFGNESNCLQVSSEWDQHSEFFVDNDLNPAIEAVEYDGFTVVLTASATIVCGETYHIKIVVADAFDTIFDSGVFLAASSFSSSGVTLTSSVDETPENFPANSVLEGCVNGMIEVHRPETSGQETLNLTISGSAVVGEDVEWFDQEIVMAPGVGSHFIPIVPVFDDTVENTEDLIVSYQYTNACGSEVTVTTSLEIMDYQMPALDLTDELILCPGLVVDLTAEVVNGFEPYTYDWGNGEDTASMSFGTQDAGEYLVSVTDYCGNSSIVDLELVEVEELEVEDPDLLCLETGFVPEVTGGAQPYSFEIFDNDLVQTEEGSYSTEVAGEYLIEVTDGCDQVVELTVEFDECSTIIPNVFTPNNDGWNDVLVILGIERFPESTFAVYNRWGNLVFESNNYKNNWDGAGLDEGTYFYTFERSDGQSWSGELALLKKNNN